MEEVEPLAVIEGLGYAFGEGETREVVLEGLDLALDRGEIVILTGPSGSGKTTLLTLIGALRSIQAGSILLDGRELKGLRAREQEQVRKDIGFIFQTHNLFDSLTAFQNVLLATELVSYSAGEAERRSSEILARVGLAEYQHKKPAQLSEGQRQRVAISRALVNEPKLVLADEPTAALDAVTGREIVQVFQERARELGTTVLIVTHDDRILDVADRIIRMVSGKVVSDTAPVPPAGTGE
jgi:putative ABC transport system ATP-binding protein